MKMSKLAWLLAAMLLAVSFACGESSGPTAPTKPEPPTTGTSVSTPTPPPQNPAPAPTPTPNPAPPTPTPPPNPTPNPDPTCAGPIFTVLDASKGRNGTAYLKIRNDGDCEYPYGVIVYVPEKGTSMDQANQILFKFSIRPVKPAEVAEFFVPLPTCGPYQWDPVHTITTAPQRPYFGPNGEYLLDIYKFTDNFGDTGSCKTPPTCDNIAAKLSAVSLTVSGNQVNFTVLPTWVGTGTGSVSFESGPAGAAQAGVSLSKALPYVPEKVYTSKLEVVDSGLTCPASVTAKAPPKLLICTDMALKLTLSQPVITSSSAAVRATLSYTYNAPAHFTWINNGTAETSIVVPGSSTFDHAPILLKPEKQTVQARAVVDPQGLACEAVASVELPPYTPPCEVLTPPLVHLDDWGYIEKSGAVQVGVQYTYQNVTGEFVGIWWERGDEVRMKDYAPLSLKCEDKPATGTLYWSSTNPAHLPSNGAKYYFVRFKGTPTAPVFSVKQLIPAK